MWLSKFCVQVTSSVVWSRLWRVWWWNTTVQWETRLSSWYSCATVRTASLESGLNFSSCRLWSRPIEHSSHALDLIRTMRGCPRVVILHFVMHAARGFRYCITAIMLWPAVYNTQTYYLSWYSCIKLLFSKSNFTLMNIVSVDIINHMHIVIFRLHTLLLQWYTFIYVYVYIVQ